MEGTKQKMRKTSDVWKYDGIITVLDFCDGTSGSADYETDSHTKVSSKSMAEDTSTDIIDFKKVI